MSERQSEHRTGQEKQPILHCPHTNEATLDCDNFFVSYPIVFLLQLHGPFFVQNRVSAYVSHCIQIVHSTFVLNTECSSNVNTYNVLCFHSLGPTIGALQTDTQTITLCASALPEAVIDYQMRKAGKESPLPGLLTSLTQLYTYLRSIL